MQLVKEIVAAILTFSIYIVLQKGAQRGSDRKTSPLSPNQYPSDQTSGSGGDLDVEL